MFRLWLATLFLAPFLMHGAYAQVDDQWFYAEDADNNQIVAYNLEGDLASVMELNDDVTLRGGWRIDSRTLLMIAEDTSGDRSMFILSPDGAEPISYSFDYGIQVVAYHYPYAVFMPVDPTRTATPAILVNVESATATNLGGDVAPIFEASPCCRFSEHGTSLRYIAKIQLDENDVDAATFQLRERDLATGEERDIYSIYSVNADNGPQVSRWQPDTDGDRWLMLTSERHDESIVRTTWMIELDGSAERIGEAHSEDEIFLIYSFWGNMTWITDGICQGGCTLDVYDEQGNQVISVQARTENFVRQIYYVGDGYVVGESGAAFLRLTPDAPPEIIGYRDPTILDGVNRSPNGRLLALMDAEDDGQYYFIYDNLSGEAIYSRDLEGASFILNTLQGEWLKTYITTRVDGEFRDIYVIADPNTAEAVEVVFQRELVGQILSLDELIVWERDREADTNRIYIYNIRAGEESLLLEGNYFPFDGTNLEVAVRN